MTPPNNKTLFEKAHVRWAQILQSGDLAINATIGNGHDTLFLAQTLAGSGKIIGYDIQEAALEKTGERLLNFSNVTLKLQSHASIDEENARLIVYNLGYLPGSDKRVTTLLETTLESLESAQKALMPGGLLSITCYPGHHEGQRESQAVLEWAKQQPGKLEIIFSRSPFLILLERAP